MLIARLKSGDREHANAALLTVFFCARMAEFARFTVLLCEQIHKINKHIDFLKMICYKSH